MTSNRNISYVYPNLSKFHRNKSHIRGGLFERWTEAVNVNCEYIEVPATLIKNKTEEQLTGLEIGDFIDEEVISKFYFQDETIPSNLKYVLHTEPSLSKPNSYGRKIQPPIKWYDSEWTGKYIDMILNIANYLQTPAEIIEIHPGYQKNTYQNICELVQNLLDKYQEHYGLTPLILLENRTEQFISRGKDIQQFWNYLIKEYPSLESNFGIVLDVQQLKSRTRDRFLAEFDMIPLDSLKGFHIHTRHRWPKLNDPIPWKYVFGRIRDIEHNIIINPEIHQHKRVKQSIQFCEELLNENY